MRLPLSPKTDDVPPYSLTARFYDHLMRHVNYVRWADYVAEPGAHLHLYGKGEARPGRKMGHVTRLSSTPCGLPAN